MTKVKWFAYDDIDEFKEYASMSSDFDYTNKNGEVWDFHIDPDSKTGIHVYDYKTKKEAIYRTIDEMIDEHMFPDGAKFKDVLYGENYLKEE